MNVQPDLLTHPKFLFLERELGDHGRDALKYLLRLWGHCQANQRGENWGRVSTDYVEMVCEWKGEASKLFTALKKPIMPGRSGFTEVKNSEFIVHDWNLHNKGLALNWFRNKSGLPNGPPHGGTPRGSPPTNGGPPTGHPNKRREEKRREEGTALSPSGNPEGNPVGSGTKSTPAAPPDPGAGDPTLAEVITRASMLDISEPEARAFFLHWDSQAWMNKGTKVVKWWQRLPSWKATGEQFAAEKKRAAGVAAPAGSLAAIEEELQWQEDPIKRAELQKKRRELGGT